MFPLKWVDGSGYWELTDSTLLAQNRCVCRRYHMNRLENISNFISTLPLCGWYNPNC